jgi:hypothetical protein
MRFFTKLTIGVLLAILTSTSFAEGSSFRGIYFGGGFSKHDIKDVDERLKGAVIKVGYDLTNFLAIEAQGGATIEETIYGVSGFSDERAEHAGIYARLNWRSMNSILYGLIGYGYYKGYYKFTSDIDPFFDSSGEREESGLSYGVGAELFGSGRTSVSASWMQLIKEKNEFDNELNVQAIYIGITHYFSPQKTTHAPY